MFQTSEQRSTDVTIISLRVHRDTFNDTASFELEVWTACLTFIYSGLVVNVSESRQGISYVVHHSLLSQCHVNLGNPQCQPPHSSASQIRSCACVSAPPDLCLTSLPRVWSLWCCLQFHCLEFSFIFLQRPACPRRNLANVGTRSVLITRSPWALSPLSHKQSRPTRRLQSHRFNYNNRSLCWEPHCSTSGRTQSSLNVRSTCTKIWNTFIWVYFGSL